MPNENRTRCERLEILLQVSRILCSSVRRDEVLGSLLDQAVQVLGAERGYVVMRQPKSKKWQIVTARALDRSAIEAEDFHLSRGIVARVSVQGRAILTSDAMHDQRFKEQASVGLYNLRSILCVPLKIETSVVGVLYLDHRMELAAFSLQDKELLESMASQASAPLEQAQRYEELQGVSQLQVDEARRELLETQARLVELSKWAVLGRLAVSAAQESCCDTLERMLRLAGRQAGEPAGGVDLGLLVSDGLALLEPELRRGQISLEQQVCKDLHVAGTAQGFAQAVLNLFFNAIDSLRGTPPPGRLQVRVWSQRQQVALAVRDSGLGMDETTRKRIVQPTFVIRDAGQGVGPGLSVTCRLLRDLGGHITVESQPGKGTTVQVIFPQISTRDSELMR